jgi:pimeloyl-ACP methyl ester carboxylesterase
MLRYGLSLLRINSNKFCSPSVKHFYLFLSDPLPFMSKNPNVIWLNASPSLRWVDQPLLRQLVQSRPIAQWEYYQSLDEASSLDTAVELLHQYLMSRPADAVDNHNRSGVHLAGHGISGVVGLLYARRFPQYVRSLTLLSVAAQPAATWHTHYYFQRQFLLYSRARLLAQNVGGLFEEIPNRLVCSFAKALERDLAESPNGHSLFRLSNLTQGGITAPLLICGSDTDPVASPETLSEWRAYLKPTDAVWVYPKGRHFFHYYHPQAVSDRMQAFWQASEHSANPTLPIPSGALGRLVL